MTWQKISSKQVYKNRFMTVTDDQVMTDHGDTITFGVVHKNDGVSVVPWDGEHLYLVGQYRYPVDYYSWEFPAGHLEHDNLESAVRAELEEEAGVIANKIIKIGDFHIAPGHNTQIIHFYLATDLTETEQHLEPAEKGMKIKKVTHDELNNLIAKGEIKDSLTIAALKFFELYLAKQIIS